MVPATTTGRPITLLAWFAISIAQGMAPGSMDLRVIWCTIADGSGGMSPAACRSCHMTGSEGVARHAFTSLESRWNSGSAIIGQSAAENSAIESARIDTASVPWGIPKVTM